ncbi:MULTISPECIES: hypothetical protein [Exiguobacterium]|uniref:hypothetical protein n=1 Tax=Exiguobacterium TaxID=33986 RepID=UPI0004789AFA|nr:MULTISPECIES: hypothetical protein [Exiguobacterium]MCT4780677.1 hypothetical protein [Exiguobacterium soli]
MKKLMWIVCLVLVAAASYVYITRYDRAYEQEVMRQVVEHVERTYGTSEPIVVKSYYNDKHRAKDKRYAVAVRADVLPLKQNQYMTYRLRDGQVIELYVIDEDGLPNAER